MEPLRIERDDHGAVVIVTPVGPVDVATAGELRQALTEAQYGGADRVVLDLDGVEFLDSFGLGVIVGALKRARSHDNEFVIVCSRERLRHLFALTRLEEIVEIQTSRDTAAGA